MTHQDFMEGIQSIFSSCRLGEIPWKEGAHQIYLAMQELVKEHPHLKRTYEQLLATYENKTKTKWFEEKCEICGHFYQWDRQSWTVIHEDKLNLCRNCAAYPLEKDISDQWQKAVIHLGRKPSPRHTR